MQVRLADIFRYFFKLGCSGFGGPVALVGYMQKDLVERDQWVTAEEFSQGVALGATLPGPLAAQVAMWIGYLRQGFWGCTVASIGLIVPPFLIVLLIAALYVQFEQTQWVRALFYGIGPAIAALVVESCYRLARKYLPDWKMTLLALACLVVTVVVHAEMAILFVAGGLLGIVLYAPWWPKSSVLPALIPGLAGLGLGQSAATDKLLQLGAFFFKAGAFTFGSGLAVAPFIHQGAVLEYGWLSEREFLDTVAVGMITPGPVVIMATFAGVPGARFLGGGGRLAGGVPADLPDGPLRRALPGQAPRPAADRCLHQGRHRRGHRGHLGRGAHHQQGGRGGLADRPDGAPQPGAPAALEGQ